MKLIGKETVKVLHDTALWAAADRHMSEGTGPEGVGTITVQRAWLGLPCTLTVEAEVGESTGYVLAALAHVGDEDVALDVEQVLPSARRVALTADEMADLAAEVSEHAREEEEAAREYALELRCER